MQVTGGEHLQVVSCFSCHLQLRHCLVSQSGLFVTHIRGVPYSCDSVDSPMYVLTVAMYYLDQWSC